MPGIAGIISHDPPADCRRLVTHMLRTMMHERFYASGACFAPEIGVYAGWVAHPGSFAARESSRGAVQKIGLALAGECFEGQSLPDPSADRDNQRHSGSSVLALYDRLDEQCIADLNGLFCGLILDRSKRRALLFNDRYGLERIYVHETEQATYFASEVKALLRVVPTLRVFDDQAVAEFLTFGCPLEGKTLFRGIKSLQGGSLWSFDGGLCRKARYFEPAQWECQPLLTPRAFEAEFQERFKKALPRYFRGEPRIGVSLTGGLDTRMIIACLPALASRPLCYTFSGREGDTLDARIAARVAAASGLEHRVLRIAEDFLSEYGAYVDRTVYITDGCSGALGAHEIYLNGLARESAPIRLTGNFGGEVLRGVSTFKPMGLSRELIHPDFHHRIDTAAGRTSGIVGSAVTSAAFREIPWNLFGTMAAARSQVVFRTPYLDNELVSLAYRAPARVRQSSGTALRLVREHQPCLSHIPTDRAVTLDGRGIAYMLKRLVAEVTFKLDYFHKEALPQRLMRFDAAIGALARFGVLGLHKYLPYRLWFRRDLAGYVNGVLTDSASTRLPYLNQRFLTTLAHDHVAGRRDYVREINAVVTLATVDRLLLRGWAERENCERDVACDEGTGAECLPR